MGNEGPDSSKAEAMPPMPDLPGGKYPMHYIALGFSLLLAVLVGGALLIGLKAAPVAKVDVVPEVAAEAKVQLDPKTSRLPSGQLVMFVVEEGYPPVTGDNSLKPGMKGDSALVIDDPTGDSPDRLVEIKLLDGNDAGMVTSRQRSHMVPISERPPAR